LGVSRSLVQQIHFDALKRLRCRLFKKFHTFQRI
jgi:DNA-directed RNA polymerase specialized sigma subunit